MQRRLAPLLAASLLTASPVAARHVHPLGDGWARFEVAAAGRTLAAAMPSEDYRAEVLVVVIEGDGAAHDSRGRPSADPTPRAGGAVGLQVARAWPGGAAWLGRPCQFTDDVACAPRDWTTHRFSQGAVDSANAAIDALKARTGAARVVLVGWSGGGVIAALAARERDDMAGLVTLAAPLDVAAWTQSRGFSPLAGLDPADLPAPDVPQLHLHGSLDPVVRPAIVRETARRWAGPRGQAETWPERHDCCWARRAGKIAGRLSALD